MNHATNEKQTEKKKHFSFQTWPVHLVTICVRNVVVTMACAKCFRWFLHSLGHKAEVNIITRVARSQQNIYISNCTKRNTETSSQISSFGKDRDVKARLREKLYLVSSDCQQNQISLWLHIQVCASGTYYLKKLQEFVVPLWSLLHLRKAWHMWNKFLMIINLTI